MARVAAPLPEPLSFLRIGRFMHLLAPIAEAIRVLSGIRLGLAETCWRVGPGEATFKVSCAETLTGSAGPL